jgi:hypothetical protein
LFDYFIERRNTNGVLQERIEDVVESLNFEYNRVGGCGSFEMTLLKRFDDDTRFEADDDIRIYVKTATHNSHYLVYRGYVNSFAPRADAKERWMIRGNGYVGQLSRIVVTATYQNALVEDIIKDILDTYLVGVSGIDITYLSADIESTGLVLSEITFDDTADNVIQKLADLVGQREWGVDENARFFFKQQSNNISQIFQLGADLITYEVIDDWESIVNQVQIRGARISSTDNTIYSKTIDNVPSQTQFGLRAKIYNNSSINNDTDANRYGQAILQESSNVTRRASADLTIRSTVYHLTKPLGVIQVPSIDEGFNRTIFGVPLYGVPKYGGMDSFQVNSIRYVLSQHSSGFEIAIDLGAIQPELFTPIAKLDFDLQQVAAR